MAYASTTEVPVSRSKANIEDILMKYGAEQFAQIFDSKKAMVQFRADERLIRFTIQLPQQNEYRTIKAYDQATRTIWRCLLLCIKAKLESVESGIATFEEEFLAQIVLPDKSTVWDFMKPQIEHAYETGNAPKMLGFTE